MYSILDALGPTAPCHVSMKRSPLRSARLHTLARARVAIAAACVAMSGTEAFAQGPMANGENHTATISAAGEIDTWTFTANAGEYISLSIGEVGADSAFWPWIRLL